jgi:hypothetical protein
MWWKFSFCIVEFEDEICHLNQACVRLSGIAAPAAASQARSIGAVLAFLGRSFLLCLCTRLHVRVRSYAASLRMTHRSCAAVSVRPGHRYTVEIVSLRVPYEYDVKVSFCLACLIQPNFIHTLVWTSEHDAFSCTNWTYIPNASMYYFKGKGLRLTLNSKSSINHRSYFHSESNNLPRFSMSIVVKEQKKRKRN